MNRSIHAVVTRCCRVRSAPTVVLGVVIVVLSLIPVAWAQAGGPDPFQGSWQTEDGVNQLVFGGTGEVREVTFTATTSQACRGHGVTATGTGTVDGTTLTASFPEPRCHDGSTLGSVPAVTFTYDPTTNTLKDNFGGRITTYVRPGHSSTE